jgi:16S rRNA (guanine1516-N2)-methyltransferase
MAHGQNRAAEVHRILLQASNPELIVEADDSGVDINLVDAQLRFHHSLISGPLARRARQPGQAIVRACSNKQRSIAKILDLTAGWGADSLALAHHGKQVTMLEQNRLVYAIVAHALERLAATASGGPIAERMAIENTSALAYLRGLGDNHDIDCIYLDPMFPGHRSGAKPSKDMQILQALTGNLEIESCFRLALGKARKRVVVKRPAKAACLDATRPDLQYREKTIRFDVYLTA